MFLAGEMRGSGCGPQIPDEAGLKPPADKPPWAGV